MTDAIDEPDLLRLPNQRRAFYLYKGDALVVRNTIRDALNVAMPEEVRRDEVWVGSFVAEVTCEQCETVTPDEQVIEVKYWGIGNTEGGYNPKAAYCRDCAITLCQRLDAYISGREDEYLGQAL